MGFPTKKRLNLLSAVSELFRSQEKKEAIIHLTISKGSENIIDGGDEGQSLRASLEHESDPLNCFLLNLNKGFLCLELTLSQNSSLFPPSSHNF